MQSVIILLIAFAGVTFAKIPVRTSGKALTDLVITDNKGSEVQLEVRQMPLAQVLDAVARKTHVTIHYSVLPEGLVTATCVGTLKQVLECLLDRKAGIIVRYPLDSAKNNSKEQVAEAWILGSRLASSPSTGSCIATADNGSLMLRQDEQVNEQSVEAELDQTDQILNRVQSKNLGERVEAISALLRVGRNRDPDVKAALEIALTDQNAQVRAQAISSLAHREGSGAAGAIQDALNDSSVDVRLKAVDGITDDIPLLQQAINDSNATIRSLATEKLELLTQGNGATQ
jgi:hypothetical protein